MDKATVYLNYGRYVADCPNTAENCTNAVEVEDGQTHFQCTGPGSCGLSTLLDWPGKAKSRRKDLEGMGTAEQSWHPRDDARPKAEPIDQTRPEGRGR